MNKYGHSETEELVIASLKANYGSIHKSIDEEVVQDKIDNSNKLYELAVKEYRVNQSAYNYNILITAMVALQYWNQKKVKLFSTTEDF